MASQAYSGTPAWLAGSFSSRETAASLWVGSVGLLVLGLQPLLLGAMVSEGKVDFDGLALIATVEIVAIAIGSTLGNLFGIRAGTRPKVAALFLMLAALHAATAMVSSLGAYLALRGLAGLVEGALVVFAIELVARSIHAQRLGGYFVIVQTLLQAVLALILALWVLPNWGSAGGFVAMAVVSVLSLGVASMVSGGYEPLPKSAQSLDGVFTARSIIVLLSIFTFFLFIGAIWAFLEPIGARSGLDAGTVGTIVSAALVAQILGAVCSTLAADRLHYGIGILACAIVSIGAVAIILSGPTPGAFWAAALAIGFVWLFVIPCQVGLAVAADQTRATATLVPAANLLGAAIGPILGSLFIVGDDVTGVVWFALGAILASMVALALAVLMLRGRTIS